MNVEIPVNWKPRSYQMGLWNFFAGDSRNKRAVVIAHRRWGKDDMSINICGVKAMERVGLYFHLLPTYRQARAVVWNGIASDKSKDGTRKGRNFLSYFHPDLIESIHHNDMRVHFKNGSIYQVVGSDEIDRLVGTNPVGVVFSEYALQDPRAFDYISPILSENEGWAIFITTIRGKNHAYRLARTAEGLVKDGDKDWFYLNHTVNDTKRDDGTPVVTPERIEKERKAGRPEVVIAQEYFNNADAPLLGSYYSIEMGKALLDGRIKNVPYDPKLNVDTAWDIGWDDSMSIVFTQTYGREIRVIDYYENSHEALRHYVRILKEKDYFYGKHYFPHDVMVTSVNDGKTRWETLRALGLKPTITFKHEVLDGIEAVRNILHQCWFDEKKCVRLIEALRSYRKEEAPKKLGYTGDEEEKPMYKDHPLKDWASHPADAFRYFAWNAKAKHEDPNHDPWKNLPTSMSDEGYQYV